MGETGTQTCQLRRIENKVIFTSPITLISLYLVIIEQIKTEISQNYQNFVVWFGSPSFDMFLLISHYWVNQFNFSLLY